MSNVVEQLKKLSVEDAVRWAIRDQQGRADFKKRFPMYDAEALRKGIVKADGDIEQFETAIRKAMQTKRDYALLLDQCEKRDAYLIDVAEKREAIKMRA